MYRDIEAVYRESIEKSVLLHGSGMPKRTLKMVQEQYSTKREKRKGT